MVTSKRYWSKMSTMYEVHIINKKEINIDYWSTIPGELHIIYKSTIERNMNVHELTIDIKNRIFGAFVCEKFESYFVEVCPDYVTLSRSFLPLTHPVASDLA